MAKERAEIDLFLNGKQVENELDKISDGLKELKERQKQALKAEDYKSYKKIGKEIDSLNRRASKLRQTNIDIKEVLKNLNGTSLRDLEKAKRKLVAQMRYLNRDTSDYIERSKALRKITIETKRINQALRGQCTFWQRLHSWINKNTGVLITYYTAVKQAIDYGIRMINSSARLSDELTDIEKTTGLTAEQVKELNGELKKIDTRSSRKELRELARDAGKLGITAKEDVLGFARASDKLNVSLKEDLGDGAIREIGKLTDSFDIKKVYGIEDSMLKVGSAINQLGASSTAQEGYIVEFTNRLAGIAPNANLSIQNVMGLGATLDALGQTSEVSSTVVSELFVDMYKDTSTYAKMAGMELSSFNQLLAKDSNEAFMKFLEGLSNSSGGFDEMVAKMGELGLEGKRSVGVLGVLTKNTKMLREQQSISNKSFDEGTSIIDEFNKKNNNLAGSWAKLQKEFNGIFTNTTVKSWMEGLVNSLLDLTKWVKRNINNIKFFIKTIVIATATLVSYKLSIKLVAMWTTKATGATILQNTVEKISIALQTAKRGVLLLVAAAQALLTGNIKRATIAMRIFNTTTKMSPIGLLIGIITAVTMAVVLFRKETKAASAAQKELNEVALQAKQNIVSEKVELEKLLAIAKDEKRNKEERLTAIKKINELSPEYLGNISLETINTKKSTDAINDYIKALEKKAKVQAAQNRLVEIEKEILKVKAEGDGIAWYETAWNGIKALGNIGEFAINQTNTALDNQKQKLEELESRKKVLLDITKEEIKLEIEKKNAGKGKGGKVKVLQPDDDFEEYDGESLPDFSITKKKIRNEKEYRDAVKKYSDELAKYRLNQALKAAKSAEDLKKARIAIAKSERDAIVNAEGVTGAQRVLANDEYKDKLKDIENQYQKDKKEILIKEGEASKISELEMLNVLYEEKLISEEEFQQRKLAIVKKYAEMGLRAGQEIAQQGLNIVDGLKQIQESKEDARHNKQLVKLKKQRDKGTITEKQYNKKVEAENNKHEAEKLEIRKKYADKEFALKVSSIIAATALSAMQSYAAMSVIPIVGPALGKIAAAMAIAAGAVQIGVAKHERDAVKGLEDGDYWAVEREQDGRKFNAKFDPNKRGFVDKPSVLVGEYGKKEFVASNKLVKNRSVKPILDVLDIAQKNGTAETINLPAVMKARGFESGGYTSTMTYSKQELLGENSNSEIIALRLAIENLSEKADKGFKAYIVLQEFLNAKSDYEQSNSLNEV